MKKVIGIISLSDILLYLVLRPSGEGVGGNDQSVRDRVSDPHTPPATKTDASDNTSMKSQNINDGDVVNVENGSDNNDVNDDIAEEDNSTTRIRNIEDNIDNDNDTDKHDYSNKSDDSIASVPVDDLSSLIINDDINSVRDSISNDVKIEVGMVSE